MDTKQLDDKIKTLMKYRNPDDPLRYIANLIKDDYIAKLNNDIMNCNKCTACNSNVKSVGYGNVNSKILIVNEPIVQVEYNTLIKYNENITTARDDIFYDKFSQYLKLINANVDYLYFIRCINCFVKKSVFNRSTNKEEIKQCVPNTEELKSCFYNYIEKYIDFLQPQVIICLGSVASNLFHLMSNNNEMFSLMNNRGKVFKYKNIDVMPTYSLSFFDTKSKMEDKDIVNQYKYEFVIDLYNAFSIEKAKNPNSNIGNIYINQ